MIQRTFTGASLVLALSCASGAAASKAPECVTAAVTARPDLAASEGLTPEAREMLSLRMQRHGQQMMFLVVNLIILRDEEVARAADEIAAEPGLGSVAAGIDDPLNALLPPRFLELQDELRHRARGVAVAAEAEDRAQLLTAYGQLTTTCVTCHAAYLHDRASRDDSGD
jgi:hypothetical protein